MKWRILLLGLAAFLLALIVVLPASWVARFAPPQVQCADWGGSIWHGQCRDMVFTPPNAAPVQIQSLRWKLHPAALLRLAVDVDFSLTNAQGEASGNLRAGRGGALALRDVELRTRVDHQLLGALPAGWNGQLEGSDLAAAWHGRTIEKLSGTLLLRELNDGRGGQLGSYRLTLPPDSAPPLRGTLADEGGPLQVQGEITLAADRSWTLDARVAPRPGSDPVLRTRLESYLGPADNSGQYLISVAGTFR